MSEPLKIKSDIQIIPYHKGSFVIENPEKGTKSTVTYFLSAKLPEISQGVFVGFECLEQQTQTTFILTKDEILDLAEQVKRG